MGDIQCKHPNEKIKIADLDCNDITNKSIEGQKILIGECECGQMVTLQYKLRKLIK